MAILHQATLSPTKLAIVTDYLDMLGWGAGPVRQVGSYRYDDPEGEVGVEGILGVGNEDIGEAALFIPAQHQAATRLQIGGAAVDPASVSIKHQHAEIL